MTDQTTLEYDQLPSVAPYYCRAATRFGGGLVRGETIPSITSRIRGLEARADHLARYRKVCGFARSSNLPVTYPHVLAFPLHMAVLTHHDFPLKLLGLIHVRNQITQYRGIAVDEPVDIDVSVAGHRDGAKGVEFDLVTTVFDASAHVVWQENAVMLSRDKKRAADRRSSGRSSSQTPALSFTPVEQATWQIPADIGRRYAQAAGDYNPIHLSSWTAKLFGFSRAIATGMWTKARAAAAMAPHLERDAYTVSLDFKKPVLLPSTVVFKRGAVVNEGADFALTSRDGEIYHLIGDIRYI